MYRLFDGALVERIMLEFNNNNSNVDVPMQCAASLLEAVVSPSQQWVDRPPSLSSGLPRGVLLVLGDVAQGRLGYPWDGGDGDGVEEVRGR